MNVVFSRKGFQASSSSSSSSSASGHLIFYVDDTGGFTSDIPQENKLTRREIKSMQRSLADSWFFSCDGLAVSEMGI
jgi:hypothetical protein